MFEQLGSIKLHRITKISIKYISHAAYFVVINSMGLVFVIYEFGRFQEIEWIARSHVPNLWLWIWVFYILILGVNLVAVLITYMRRWW